MRFFFYGTLGEGMDNPVINAIRPKLGPAQPATVTGRLHALPDRDGWYPGLTVEPDGTVVRGALYDAGAGFTAEDLARLDAYEAYDPADEASSEYVRRQIGMTCDDGSAVQAHAYLYNRPLPPGALAIAEESFPAFLAARGYRALAPRDP